MEEKILKHISILNNEDTIESQYFFKRNSIYYRLVCYINNITGCFMSKNYESIPVFINRVYKEVHKLKKIDEINISYLDLCLEYASIMANFLIDKSYLIDKPYCLDLIPDELINSDYF